MGQSIVIGRLRFLEGAEEYPFWASDSPIWPWQPDVRLKLQLVRVEPRELSFIAPVREGGSFYWYLPPGQYLLTGYLYVPGDSSHQGAQPLGTCLPEGASRGASLGVPTLAVFAVFEEESAVYLGTLDVEVKAAAGLQWIWEGDASTSVCVYDLRVRDQLESQLQDLQMIFPGSRMLPSTRLMATGFMLPSPQDAELKRKVDEALSGTTPP